MLDLEVRSGARRTNNIAFDQTNSVKWSVPPSSQRHVNIPILCVLDYLINRYIVRVETAGSGVSQRFSSKSHGRSISFLDNYEAPPSRKMYKFSIHLIVNNMMSLFVL